MSSSVDEWLSHTLRHINDALPRRVERLSRLLEMDEPYVETVGGWKHFFNKKELQQIKEMLPATVAERLYLPFVFVKNHESEEPFYIIRERGSEAEAFRIIMGLAELPKTSGKPYTYKILVAEFLNRFPSLGVMGYI